MNSCPGNIIEIIDNPIFSLKNMREMKEFGELSIYIRDIIKSGWKT